MIGELLFNALLDLIPKRQVGAVARGLSRVSQNGAPCFPPLWSPPFLAPELHWRIPVRAHASFCPLGPGAPSNAGARESIMGQGPGSTDPCWVPPLTASLLMGSPNIIGLYIGSYMGNTGIPAYSEAFNKRPPVAVH